MRINRLAISFLLVVFSASSVAIAQTEEKEKAEKGVEKRQELERKSLALLDETIASAWGLRLVQNRSFIFESAANLLWTRDEKRARRLFWDGFNSLNLPAAPTEINVKLSPAEKAKLLNEYYAAFNLRQSFLRGVAQRDPQLALDMLRSTHWSPPQNLDVNYQLPDERDLEQDIANEAAARDPKQALRIARESLAKGLTFQVLGFFYELNRRNPDAASEFANDLINKIDSSNLENDVVAWRTGLMLLSLSRVPRNASTENSDTPQSKSLKLTYDQKHTLVDKITEVTLSASAKPGFVSEASEVMPEIEEFAPDRAASIKAKMANVTLTKQQLGWGSYDSLFRDGTPQDMLRAGTKLTPDVRNQLDQQAVVRAVGTGKGDEIRDFINSDVQDETRKRTLVDSLDAEQIAHAVSAGNVDELEKLLPSIRAKQNRARALAELAIILEKNGQHDDAVKYLDEAYGLAKLDLKSDSQSTALLTVLMGYALIDPPKAFAIIEPIVDRVNDEVSKLMLVDKFFRTGIASKGEILIQQSGMLPVDFLVFKYGRGINALASADFNRTKALADRFQRNELRIMARLMIARTLLQDDNEQAKTAQ